MTGRGGTLAALVAAALVLAAGVGGTAAASSGGNPAPTADPGELSVSLTDGTVNATYRVNTTSGTVNASYAGDRPDVNVSYTDSATAIQFALDNATAENDTVVLGGGTFNGSVDVGARTGLTLDGGYSRLDGDAGRDDTDEDGDTDYCRRNHKRRRTQKEPGKNNRADSDGEPDYRSGECVPAHDVSARARQQMW